MTLRPLCAFVLLLAAACGDDAPNDDTTEPDGGLIDGSRPLDASLDSALDAARVDSGVTDAGSDSDSGEVIVPEATVACLRDPIGRANTLLSVHTSQPGVQVSSSRLLSADARWILRDRATLAIIATGAEATAVHLNEAWLVLRYDTRIEVRRPLDAGVVWTQPIDSARSLQSGISRDGSYVWLASEAGLRAFETGTGRELLSHPGDYAGAQVVAIADELRIRDYGRRAERVPLTGPSHLIELESNASAWSADGRHLLSTLVGANFNLQTHVYDANGALEGSLDATPYSSVGAYGDYVWIRNPAQGATVWRLGDGTAPRLWTRALNGFSSQTLQFESWLLVPEEGETWTLVDLAQPVLTPRRVPAAYGIKAFAMSGRDLYFSTAAGIYVVPDGAARATRIACGAVTEVALAQDGSFALSIGAQQVLLVEAATRTVRAALPGGTRVSFSRDGNVLGLLDADARLALFDARTGDLLTHEPAPAPSDELIRPDYDLAADGSSYLVTRCTAFRCESRHVDRRGASESPSSYEGPIGYQTVFPRIAPAGVRSAYPDGAFLQTINTRLFAGTSDLGATAGRPLVWLDDERLLVNRYVMPEGAFDATYTGSYVVSASGVELGKSPASLDEARAVALRGGTRIFSPTTGRLYESIGENTTPLLTVGDGSILGDATDQQLLFVPLTGANAGSLQLRGY